MHARKLPVALFLGYNLLGLSFQSFLLPSNAVQQPASAVISFSIYYTNENDFIFYYVTDLNKNKR